jgi:hypothetical protein
MARIAPLTVQKHAGAEESTAAVTCTVPNSPLEDLLAEHFVLLPSDKVTM